MNKTFLPAFALLILAACSSPNPSSAITGDWKLLSYGDPANLTPALPNVDTAIKIDSNGQISGNVGCNNFGGTYEVSGDKISFSSMMSTMMFCDETSAQEQVVLRVLSDNAISQLHMEGDSLTITSADGSSVVNLARK